MGNGESIQVGHSRWLPRPITFKHTSLDEPLDVHLMVPQLINKLEAFGMKIWLEGYYPLMLTLSCKSRYALLGPCITFFGIIKLTVCSQFDSLTILFIP